LESAVHFGLESVLLHCLLGFDLVYPFFIFVIYLFLHLEMVSNFHLIFNKVFCLCEVADKFLSLFPSQVADPGLVNNVGYFELLFLERQFLLFVKKFLSQYLFLLVEIYKHF